MIKFTRNTEKAQQCLIWILNKKPGISKYHIMKIMFAADCYHLDHYGRPIYGEKYVAMRYGTVPSFMKDLLDIKSNMPFMECSPNCYVTNCAVNYDVFSETDLEALEKGVCDYADLSFKEVKDKNHAHQAWKNHEKELNDQVKSVPIPYEEMITNQDVLEDLKDLGTLTENMVF